MSKMALGRGGLLALGLSLSDAYTSNLRHRQKRGVDSESSGLRILYGIESCNVSAYNAMVKAQLDTWGSDLPRDDFVIVGGEYDDYAAGLISEASPCEDSQGELVCKEAVLLDRAVDRARKLDAHWLVVGQDDKYIWPKELEKALTAYDSTQPLVVGQFGCGRAWKYNPDSQGGTLPRPSGWIEPGFSCDQVYEHGSLCGGATYFVSRGALEKIKKKGQSFEEYIAEVKGYTQGIGGQASDVGASCLYYDRNIPIEAAEGELVQGMIGGVSSADFLAAGSVQAYIDGFKKTHPETPITMHLDTGYNGGLKKEEIDDLIKVIEPAYPALIRTRSNVDAATALQEVQLQFLYALHKSRAWNEN